jgi:hypothetical protein
VPLMVYVRWAARRAAFLLATTATLVLPLALPSEEWVKLNGLGLQLLGFYSVWRQLQSTLVRFNLPRWWGGFASWLRAPPIRRVEISAHGTTASSAMANATVVHTPTDSTIEGRIGVIERNQDQLRRDIAELQRAQREDRASFEARHNAERAAWRESAQTLTQRLTGQSIDGIEWQFAV